MAIAKPSAGVTIGYKPKVKQVERRKPTLLQRVVVSLLANAREMREFAADEIVYATMDTVRLLHYLRYEFGWAQGRRRTEGRFAPERLVTIESQVVGWSDGPVVADGI